MSRLENSTKNLFLSLFNSVFSSLLGIISRTVFIKVLGTEYLGLAGLLGNILGFLAISELGISTAIGFSLYKPLAEKDYKSVSALMTVYRKAYAVIGGIVFFSGIRLFYALDFFIPVNQQPNGTEFAYFAFLINTTVGYFLSYKTTLISSDNQAYRLAPIYIGMSVVQTILQITVLLIFKSYIIYLSIQIACSIATMFLQNRYITKKYEYVDFYSEEKLNPEQENQLKRNISGLIIAKIGDYLVNSTDNLIITKLVSLSATGIYSNYLMIRNMVNGYIGTVFSSVTAALGNVVAIETDERKKESFDIMMFFAYFVYSFEAVCFLCLFNTFIGEIWIGKQYVFDFITVLIIVVNNFLTGLRIPLITMKNVAGKYMEDAWIPFAFAIVNLVASIILVKHFGVSGVFLGTIIGSLFTADWYRPIVIYHKVFHTSVMEYYKKYIVYIILGFLNMAIAYSLCTMINTKVILLNFIMKAFITASLPIIINSVIFYRTKEFKAITDMVKRIFRKVMHREN